MVRKQCLINIREYSIIFYLILLLLFAFPSVSGDCDNIENISSCNQTIADYIIDGDIDLRTLSSNLTENQPMSEDCSEIESDNVSDEFDFCMNLYSTAFPNDSSAKEQCTDNPVERNWIEDIQSCSYGNTFSESIGCWGCEAGTYESNEGSTNCQCDQDEKCFDYFTQSTAVAGGTSACFWSCSSDSKTDYCIGLNTLREYYVDCYCCDEVYYEDYDCNNFNSNSNWYNYCSGNELWKQRWYYDYDCSVGACAYDSSGSGWLDDTYIKTCSCGCLSGACVSPCPPDIRVYPTTLRFEFD